jgi:RHS repeat-associated protein
MKSVETGANGEDWQYTSEFYFYGIDGRKLMRVTCDASYSCQTADQYRYFAGRMLGGPGTTVTTDRLGSIRSNEANSRYLPYGEETAPTANGKERYATYVRDSSSGGGQDYAMARYYSPTDARFLSPDPIGLRGAILSDPRSWNRYAYTRGDPGGCAIRRPTAIFR